MPLDIYNSKVYLAGKHTWDTVTLSLRDDVTGKVQKLVGEQLQKQFDFFEQSSAASGLDYKFTQKIEILDGGNGQNEVGVLETWELYGCFLTNVDYGTLNYANNDAVTVALTIQYDNAIQLGEGVGSSTVARNVSTSTTGGGS